jgi:hypothetical protein
MPLCSFATVDIKAGVRAFDLAARSEAFSDPGRATASLGATLPGVSQAIKLLGVRFFDQLTLTAAQPCIAFAAAGGDAPAGTQRAQTDPFGFAIFFDKPIL